MSVVIKHSLFSPSISPAQCISSAQGLNRLALGVKSVTFFYDEELVNAVSEKAWALEHVGAASPGFHRTFLS
jgi:hypothetical protein